MDNLAVNSAERALYPLGDSNSQSIYDYFAVNKHIQSNTHTNEICFVSHDGKLQKPYRIFNRSFEENPQCPYFRIMDHSNSLLTVWHGQSDKEPDEFELLDLSDMSHENIVWLRASGEVLSLVVNKMEKLLAMVYHDESWRVDIRRSGNFQLREVVHHSEPVRGVFFHNDVLFSLSNKLIASYPETRHGNTLVSSTDKVLGWVKHPTDPYLLLIEAERYRIIDLNTLKLVKTAEWTEHIKWFNLLQKYSNHSFERTTDKSTAVFSSDGNRLFMGGYGQLAVFDWHDMLRPRCMHLEPSAMINIHSSSYSANDQKKLLAAHIIDMVPINRDRLLCATADGYLSMVNIRSMDVSLLLTPGTGVRMNSLQLCANNKYLAMVGYHYGFDDDGCTMESALLVWKLSRLLNKGNVI
jgi:hypothetical protein